MTVRSLDRLLARLSNARHGNNAADLRDLAESVSTGILGYAQVTANQTGISAVTDLTGLSVMVDIATNRFVRITGHTVTVQRGSAGVLIARIYEDATQLQRFGQHGSSIDQSVLIEGSVVLDSPSAGSHTYKLRLSTTAGTVDSQAAADFPAFILVEDIGPS